MLWDVEDVILENHPAFPAGIQAQGLQTGGFFQLSEEGLIYFFYLLRQCVVHTLCSVTHICLPS